MFGPYELAHGFIKVNNRTAMLEYVEMSVHTMVSYGIDGFALDIEGDVYSVLSTSSM
eukprot:SAG31_NODE_11221_length_1052_cov_1.643232_2_plen_57_part_00